MSPYVYHNVGMFRPGSFKNSTESSSFVPGSKPMIVDPKDFNALPGSSWDSWSPERVKAAKAEGRAWQLAAQKSYRERSAAAAAAPGAYRFDEPEPGATSNDVRIYTKLKSGDFKYWGVIDDDMDIEDFWAKFDPENTRYLDDNEDNPLEQGSAENGSLSNNPTLRVSAATGLKRREKTPQNNPQHRVCKSPSVTPQTDKRTRQSLAAKIHAGISGLDERPPETGAAKNTSAKNLTVQASGKSRGRGRPRKVQPSFVEPTSPNTDPISSTPAKRKRGRPAKTEVQPKSSPKLQRPAAERNAKITKPKQRRQRSQAPSTHAMRTRAKGPVNGSMVL